MSCDHSPQSRFFIYKGNLRLHYQVAGDGPVTLLLLHGFASSHTTWHDLAPHFPPDRYTLFLLDMKGFGLSSKPRDDAYSIEDQAGIVKAFIREQKLASIILVGHSLGGAVALRLCIEAMDEQENSPVKKLVLIECAAYPQKLPKFFRRLRLPVIGPLLLRLVPVSKMVRAALERVFTDPAMVTPERIERYISYFRGKGIPYALRATVRKIDPKAYASISDKYRALSVPALIIWGKEDRIIRVKNGIRLHSDLTGSTLKILEECGHCPQEECPEETFSAMDAFIQDQ